MSDNTDSVPTSIGDDSVTIINPSMAEGRSRVLLFGGLAGLAIGQVIDMSILVWGGVGIIAIAFALNTAGKLVHYRALPIPSRNQLVLSATWAFLAVTVVGLLANFAYTRYGVGDGAYFWALAVAGVGFGLLHMGAQSRYLPEPEGDAE